MSHEWAGVGCVLLLVGCSATVRHPYDPEEAIAQPSRRAKAIWDEELKADNLRVQGLGRTGPLDAVAQRKAAAMGISLTEYVRRLVARDLESSAPEAIDVSVIFDLGDSGGSDITRDKDRMLGEAASAG